MAVFYLAQDDPGWRVVDRDQQRLQVDGLPVNIERQEGNALVRERDLPKQISRVTRILIRARIHLERGSRIIGHVEEMRDKDKGPRGTRPVHQSCYFVRIEKLFDILWQ